MTSQARGHLVMKNLSRTHIGCDEAAAGIGDEIGSGIGKIVFSCCNSDIVDVLEDFPPQAHQKDKDHRPYHGRTSTRKISVSVDKPQEQETHRETAEEVHEGIEPDRIPVQVEGVTDLMQTAEDNDGDKSDDQQSSLHLSSITKRKIPTEVGSFRGLPGIP
jgi:hypothetical protein